MTKSFKIYFYDQQMDVAEVKNYFNVSNQAQMLENIALHIIVLGYQNVVKALDEYGKDYTEAVNNLLKYEIEELS